MSFIFGFVVGLLNALGRYKIPNRIADILSSEDSNHQLLSRYHSNIQHHLLFLLSNQVTFYKLYFFHIGGL